MFAVTEVPQAPMLVILVHGSLPPPHDVQVMVVVQQLDEVPHAELVW
jgi:hypothetical protein